MSSTINRSLEPQDLEDGSAGVARSEPPRGRAQLAGPRLSVHHE
jgi:hypothetical protein